MLDTSDVLCLIDDHAVNLFVVSVLAPLAASGVIPHITEAPLDAPRTVLVIDTSTFPVAILVGVSVLL